MHRRFLIGLAPLLAIAALVVPVAAQAVPLNFSNGAKLKESNGVFGEAGVKEVIGWGTLEIGRPAVDKSGAICHTAIGGSVWNPIGGGPGKGETQAWAVWHCETNCAAGEVVNVVPEELPWLSTLTENGLAKTNFIRSHTEHVKMDVTCNGASFTHYQGSYQPGAPAGEDKGTSPAHPGFLEFDQPGSGQLEDVVLGGPVPPFGTVAELGYAEQELIQAK